MANGGGEMTLVFAYAALKRLARPDEAVESSKAWSDFVGVVADMEPGELKDYLEESGVEPNIVSGKRGPAGSIAAIRQRFPSDRHVFIGTTDEHENIAQALGWEFLHVEDAAKDADWPLKGGHPGDQEENQSEA